MGWRDWIYAGLATEAMLSVRRKTLPAFHVAVLMYHDLAPDDADIEAWTVVRRSDFLRQLEYVRQHYEVVGIDEAISRMATNDFRGRPLAVFTFDDGGSGNATVLHPIVESTGLPVTIYVATGQVESGVSPWFDQVINMVQTERPITLRLSKLGLGEYTINQTRGAKNWSQIQRLLEDIKRIAPGKRPLIVAGLEEELRSARRRTGMSLRPMTVDSVKRLAAVPGVTIGAHSHCHNLLTQVGLPEASQSILTSMRLLEKWTGNEVKHFAYPNGSFNDKLVTLVADLGLRSATTTKQDLWLGTGSLFLIPRLNVGRYDSLAEFKVSLLRRA